MANDWLDNVRGKPPRDPEALCEVIWANGMPAKQAYFVRQLKWEIRGEPFDIKRYRRA